MRLAHIHFYFYFLGQTTFTITQEVFSMNHVIMDFNNISFLCLSDSVQVCFRRSVRVPHIGERPEGVSETSASQTVRDIKEACDDV